MCGRWASRTGWSSAGNCPPGPEWSPSRVRCSTTMSRRAGPRSGSPIARRKRCCARRWPAWRAGALASGPVPGDEAFGADLYRRLPGQGNLVFSPASIATALRLVLLGARGETATQIAAALHLDIPDGAAPARQAAQELQAVSAILSDLAAGDLTLRAPNAMWVQSGLPLEPGFTAAVAAAAAVAVRDADFRQAAEQARQEINQFIAEQTAGKISDLLGPGVVSAATSLVLASAVYLKAAWAHPFPAGATHDAVFYLGPGTQVTVPTMRLRARLRY